jgi:hypothetical protein
MMMHFSTADATDIIASAAADAAIVLLEQTSGETTNNVCDSLELRSKYAKNVGRVQTFFANSPAGIKV